MNRLSTPTYIIKRLADDWKLLLSVFFGITIASTLVAAAPVYIKTLQRLSLSTAIDRSSNVFLDIFASTPHIPLDRSSIEISDQTLDQAVQDHIPQIYGGRERYLRAPTHLVGVPGRPLPATEEGLVSLGYSQYLSNLEKHVRFVEGRMATDVVSVGPRGPVIEGVVGTAVADEFGLSKGDEVTLTPSLGDPTRITANVVGVMEPIDPTEEYWHRSASVFLEPGPLEEGGDQRLNVLPGELTLALFITREAMIEGVGEAYPGSLVDSSWFLYVDKESLKEWSTSESRSRLQAMESQLSAAFQGSGVFTGIERLVDDFEQRSFFSSVPLFLLLAIMVITVLYYLSMMVSYLVQSRESDVALLRSRGVSTLQLLRLYALEGMALTVVAAVLAPFIAIGAVAVAGKLPYFREITGGSLLPVELDWAPFAVAAGAGLLGLAVFVVPGVVGARTGLVIHKLRSSRPPTLPFFQRYYMDVGLLALGGLVFWELHERGQIVSGGLFGDVEVNEALLLAPVLFLIVFALMFMRFFPLFVRFIGGESPVLLHLVAAATVASLASATVFRDVRDGNELAWLAPVAVLAAAAGAYWATHRAQRPRARLGGLAIQGGLVALFVVLEPPVSGEIGFVPTISLISIVPAQVAFSLFRALTQVSPVWLSMGLWHMARNPLQYSWLVLLLVLVTGLGVMATTVGGTLDRSQRERVLYDVATDIRVSEILGFSGRSREFMRERYLTIPGVASASLALRGRGTMGASFAGNRFDVLAVESQDFSRLSWYRDDFSTRPISGVMLTLQLDSRYRPVLIPEGATGIGVWTKPDDLYPNVFLWMVIQGDGGNIATVTLGKLGSSRWSLMTAAIPAHLEPPLQLLSVQLFEPGFGPVGTPGSILFDDIHATVGANGEEQIIDDFEGSIKWTALATSKISSDSIAADTGDAHSGDASGLFSFGKDTLRGLRGIYHSESGGRMPVAASTSFMAASGISVGDSLIVGVMGHLIPIVIEDTVDYFPTMNPHGGGFILADLDSLLRHLNILSPTATIGPNEVFIAEGPSAVDGVRDTVLGLSGITDRVHDRETLLESIRLDPMVTAGWRAMVLLSIGIIVFTAGLGYVTYLLSLARRSRIEMGFLRSLGLSHGQMTGLLSLEHLIVAVIGLGLGTWAGFQMSALAVSSVAVTEEGQRVVPPFILTTDWSFMLPIYAALAAIFLATLYRLVHSMRHLDLQSIARTEGH